MQVRINFLFPLFCGNLSFGGGYFGHYAHVRHPTLLTLVIRIRNETTPSLSYKTDKEQTIALPFIIY